MLEGIQAWLGSVWVRFFYANERARFCHASSYLACRDGRDRSNDDTALTSNRDITRAQNELVELTPHSRPPKPPE